MSGPWSLINVKYICRTNRHFYRLSKRNRGISLQLNIGSHMYTWRKVIPGQYPLTVASVGTSVTQRFTDGSTSASGYSESVADRNGKYQVQGGSKGELGCAE